MPRSIDVEKRIYQGRLRKSNSIDLMVCRFLKGTFMFVVITLLLLLIRDITDPYHWDW